MIEPLSRRRFAQLLGVGAATAALRPVAPALARISPAAPATARTAAAAVVRLSANENPYGPSPAAFAAMREAFSLAWRYPDEHADSLAADLARHLGVGADHVLLGDGSSEILKLCVAAAGRGRTVTAEPTFEAVQHYAKAAGVEVVTVPLTADYRHDLPKMLAAAGSGGGLVYLCNPNNPTASLTPKAEVRDFLAALPASTLALVDEAYFHFVDSPDYESVVPLVDRYPNLVVARTFSKIYGMAGLRCGFAVAQPATLERLREHQSWDSVSIMALAAARAGLADHDHVERGRRLNAEVKRRVVSQLAAMGRRTIPSHANFLMVDLGRDVRPAIAAMKQHGVEVGRFFPPLPNFMRVTIGTGEQMERFLGAFRTL
jgi:histidinol-phosphate aminotransferase